MSDSENTDVGWFTAENLPSQLPGEMSIARKLIDSFLESCNSPMTELRDGEKTKCAAQKEALWYVIYTLGKLRHF